MNVVTYFSTYINTCESCDVNASINIIIINFIAHLLMSLPRMFGNGNATKFCSSTVDHNRS